MNKEPTEPKNNTKIQRLRNKDRARFDFYGIGQVTGHYVTEAMAIY